MAVQKTADFPQLQFLAGRRHLFRYAEAVPLVQAVQQTTEIPQSFIFGGRRPCLCGRAGSRLLSGLRQSRSHSAARRHHRRGTEADPMVQTVRLTIDIAQLLYTVIDVPVVQDERVHMCRRGEDSRAPTFALSWLSS